MNHESKQVESQQKFKASVEKAKVGVAVAEILLAAQIIQEISSDMELPYLAGFLVVMAIANFEAFKAMHYSAV
jgi:hypothetical protein